MLTDNRTMIIEGYPFTFAAWIEPAREPDGTISSLLPQSRYHNVRGLPLNNYGAGPYCKFTISPDLRQSGVYVILSSDAVRYVGECANLSRRFNAGYGNISPKNCFKGGQETNCRLNSLIFAAINAGEKLSLHFHQTVDYKSVEATLRATLRAPWNRA